MSSTGSYSSGGMPKNPTFSTLKISAGGTFDLYNTADQTTNYERLRASFISNRAEVGTFYAGTGTPRQMRVGAGTSSTLSSYLGFYSQQFPFIEAVLPNTASSGVLAELFKGSFTGSASTQTIASIQPTINQSGTAGYTALDINPTETATGSGTKLLQRWAVGGATRSEINTSGTYFAANVYCNLTGSIGWSTNSSSSNLDLALNRDAADTLALRRGANAQTFRGYEAYTDGSNYSRWYQAFSAGFAYYGTQAAGTGTRRPLIVQHHQTTVAALPAAATVGAGSRCHVSDALGPVFGTAVAGGGAVSVPVYSDGANWIVG